jgi:hypothetical protein
MCSKHRDATPEACSLAGMTANPGRSTELRSLPVLGVVGGCGGIGATRFAATLAAVAARPGRRSVLIDLDLAGGGIDVPLGIDGVPGARWSGLRLAGGRLDPGTVFDGLPHWSCSSGAVAVLAADTPEPPAAAVLGQVVAAARAAGPVVLDLARWQCGARSAALALCDLVVLVAAADVRAVAGARGVGRAVAEEAPGVDIGAVVVARRGSARAVAQLVGVPLLGRFRRPALRADVALSPAGLSVSACRAATAVLARFRAGEPVHR